MMDRQGRADRTGRRRKRGGIGGVKLFPEGSDMMFGRLSYNFCYDR